MIRIVFLLILIFLLSMPPVSAAQVVINEVAWMGSEVAGVDARQWWRYEWIELYNLSDSHVSVSGWTIELRRPSSSVGKEKLDFVIPLQGTIKQKEYFVAGSSHKIEHIDVNYGSLMGKFANDGQHIVLKNTKGNIIDQVNAQVGWFAGDNETKLTMERRFPEQDSSNAENWGSSLAAGGTLKSENTIFQRESVLNLDDNPSTSSGQAKKSPAWALFSMVFTNIVFILAFLLALGASLSVLFLRRYLQSADVNSSDALQG